MKVFWVHLAVLWLVLEACLGEIEETKYVESTFLSSDSDFGPVDESVENTYRLPKIEGDKSADENTKNADEGFKTAEIAKYLVDINGTALSREYLTSCPNSMDAHGIYTVSVPGLAPFDVSCDSNMAGPGWIVIARRTNEELNFYRKWAEYKRGFGNLSSDFFIGLDKLHAITTNEPHELYVYLEDFDGNSRFARYDRFLVASEYGSYEIQKLGSYSGDAGDCLRVHENMKFTTFDRNNDLSNDNCAIKRMGAWWYRHCHHSNLFGMYLSGYYDQSLFARGIVWDQWRGDYYSLKTIQMMVRLKYRFP